MKKIDPAQVISILANFGVIAGIVFLGIELQQNNQLMAQQHELMAQQQRYNRLLMATSTSDLFIENPDIAALAVKSVQGLKELTAIELRQMSSLETRVIQAQEWSFRELPRDELPETLWKNNSKRESWRQVWAQRKPDLDPEFVQFMEENVISH